MFALSQTPAFAGHPSMTNIPNSPDLSAIAHEAQVEILVAETIQATAGVMSDDASHAFDTAEKAVNGKRGREWTAVARTEVGVVREMARCLGELAAGRWSR